MIRLTLKALAALAGIVLVAGSVFVINLIWFRPFSLNLFYEKVFIAFALKKPELLTSLGIAEQFGYRRHNAHLDDVSVAQVERDFADLRANVADLKAYPLDSQTPEQQLSTRVLAWFLESQLEGERYRFHDYPVNQLFGVQNDTPDGLINRHRIEDARGAEDYLARLGQMGRKFDQTLEGLVLREKQGVAPPRFVIERVLVEMHGFAGKPTAENPLYANFERKVGVLAGVSAAEKQALLARCAKAIDESVRPAYRKLIDFFEGQRTRATSDDGVWKLPDGDAFYAWRLRNQTTTRMTPQQVHDLGLAEVARIEGEMASLLGAQGVLAPGVTPGQAMARMAVEPRFLYPNDDAGRQAALADYRRMVDEQVVRSRAVFGLLPKATIEVKRVPEFRELTAPGAYYQPPALDGSRPGVFFVNLRDMSAVPKFAMRTLAIHEGVPGHHYQIALAQEQSGGPTFRKVIPFTAYSEGWALYAEWLGKQLGVYRDDPWSDLGRLQAEMFRAARLVVDTGIHHKRWTRQQAIDYMLAKTGMPETEVVAEIERYIVEPGQACAYKVGMLSILAARERAKRAAGARWDAEAEKAFHDTVLGSGALPLEIVDQLVDAWIVTRR